jgi:hypothetical protein
MDLKSARSSGQKMTSALIFYCLIDFKNSSDLRTSLAPKIIVQFLEESYSIVAFPIPAFPPVMTITFPLKSRSTLQTPPLKNFLANANSENVMAAAPKIYGFLTAYLILLIFIK